MRETADVIDVEHQLCRNRIDDSIKEMQNTGAVVHIVHDQGEYVYVQVAYGIDHGDWFEVENMLPLVLIDGRAA